MLLLLCDVESAMTASTWFRAGSNGKSKLALLPFALEDALQPGEARDIFLFDEGLIEALQSSAINHDCVGGLLFTDEGEAYDLAMLLQVDEVKIDDQFCAWGRIRCISRCKVSHIRKNKRHGYRVATATIYTDAHSDNGSGDSSRASAATAAQIETLRDTHEQVARARRELFSLLGGDDSGDREDEMSEHIYTSPDRRRSPFGLFMAGDEFDGDDDDDDDDDNEAEYVFIGQPWERPGAMGMCFFDCRDPGEV